MVRLQPAETILFERGSGNKGNRRRQAYRRAWEVISERDYAYVNGNPVNLIDPTGQFFVLAFGPSLATGLADLAVMGSALWAAQNAQHIPDAAGPYSPWSPDQTVNDQFQRDRDKVKEKDVKPPPYEDPNKPKCDEIRDRIKRIKEAMRARDYLTNTWYGGVWDAGHEGRQATLQKELDKYQARLDRGDCEECP